MLSTKASLRWNCFSVAICLSSQTYLITTIRILLLCMTEVQPTIADTVLPAYNGHLQCILPQTTATPVPVEDGQEELLLLDSKMIEFMDYIEKQDPHDLTRNDHENVARPDGKVPFWFPWHSYPTNPVKIYVFQQNCSESMNTISGAGDQKMFLTSCNNESATPSPSFLPNKVNNYTWSVLCETEFEDILKEFRTNDLKNLDTKMYRPYHMMMGLLEDFRETLDLPEAPVSTICANLKQASCRFLMIPQPSDDQLPITSPSTIESAPPFPFLQSVVGASRKIVEWTLYVATVFTICK